VVNRKLKEGNNPGSLIKIMKDLICNVMKNKSLKFAVFFILVMIASCDEPETVVTNIIHPDGSVTRRIEMKNRENKFKRSNIQVPFDTTWIVRDSLEIDEKGDTIWVKRAEKLFKSVDEINRDYLADSSSNKTVKRRTEFTKKFMWFNTEYRFAEIIDETLLFGYPVSDFLNGEELLWFYSPENIIDKKTGSPDSLKYKSLNDTVNKKVEDWEVRNIVSEWIGTFAKLTEKSAGDDMTEGTLKARENEFIDIIAQNQEHFDSLWTNGYLLKEFIGEANSLKYKTEADSSIEMVSDRCWVDFSNYIQRAGMPGKVIGTNGFIDTTGLLLWPVKSDFFLTTPYEMWAESKTPNKWAWIVTGAFLLFVMAVINFKAMRK